MAVALRRAFFVTAFVTLLYATGCSSYGGPARPSPPEPLQPVSGVVNYNGKPAEGVRVRFVRTSGGEATPVACNTLTDAGGKFVCPTYLNLYGLPTGKYSVYFTWPVPTSSDPTDDEIDRFGGKYGPQSKQAIAIDVKPGDNQLPPFNLK